MIWRRTKPMRFAELWVLGLMSLALMLASPQAVRAQRIKLYLKDGSYQLVKSYEVQGDRIRYYSLDRSDWEEIPVALVDFDATKRAQEQQKETQKQEFDEAEALDKERLAPDSNTGFQIAPGFRLPADEGVYAFDGKRVIRMIQSTGELVRDKKRMALLMAMPAPLLKNRTLVVLQGAKAAVRIFATHPTFYAQFSDGSGARLQLIPVRSHKDLRVVEKIQGGLGVGKNGELRDSVPLERTQLAPDLYMLRPSESLPYGEYAIGELIESKLNLEVWDFGIENLATAK